MNEPFEQQENVTSQETEELQAQDELPVSEETVPVEPPVCETATPPAPVKKSGYGNSYWVLLWQKIPNVSL